MLKKTPFYEKHIEMGGRMVEFAGFRMPIQYKGVVKEVLSVRKRFGLFDVSHMGEIKLTGKDAENFVSYITINNPKVLEDFQVQYSALCYEDGGIVDDLLVYKFPDHFLLVVNAANTEKDYEWIVKNANCKMFTPLDNLISNGARNAKWDVLVENISEKIAQLAIQGPKAEEVLKPLFDIDISRVAYYHSAMAKLSGIDVLLSRTGYTGEDGFELYFDAKHALDVWDALFKEVPELEPCGLAARDILRFEARYCLYGNDIDETTNPIEAGLSWITKLDKETFIGKEAILKTKENIKRRLTGFVMERGIPRKGFEIYKGGIRVGTVTSGGYSPTLKKGIGLGYIDVPHHKSGGTVDIKIKDRLEPATIIKGAFYKRGRGK